MSAIEAVSSIVCIHWNGHLSWIAKSDAKGSSHVRILLLSAGVSRHWLGTDAEKQEGISSVKPFAWLHSDVQHSTRLLGHASHFAQYRSCWRRAAYLSPLSKKDKACPKW